MLKCKLSLDGFIGLVRVYHKQVFLISLMYSDTVEMIIVLELFICIGSSFDTTKCPIECKRVYGEVFLCYFGLSLTQIYAG